MKNRILRFLFDCESEDQRFEKYRLEQMQEIGFVLSGPVAVAVILVYILVDKKLFPMVWNSTWIYMRLLIVPVCGVAMWIFKTPAGRKWPEVPVLLVVSYLIYLAVW